MSFAHCTLHYFQPPKVFFTQAWTVVLVAPSHYLKGLVILSCFLHTLKAFFLMRIHLTVILKHPLNFFFVAWSSFLNSAGVFMLSFIFFLQIPPAFFIILMPMPTQALTFFFSASVISLNFLLILNFFMHTLNSLLLLAYMNGQPFFLSNSSLAFAKH